MRPVICWNGSVSASFFGIMKQSGVVQLDSAVITRPNGSFSVSTMVLSSLAERSLTRAMIAWPPELRTAQRRIEATQSAAVTGVSSCQPSPSRSSNV